MTQLQMTQLSADAFDFARTDTLTKAIHLAECPHLVGKRWHEATATEMDQLRLCHWSEKQLSGHGRSHPASLAAAMREQGTPAAAVPLIREALKFVTYAEIWLPYSKCYVALGLGGRAVASFGKSYVKVAGRRVDLPGYAAGRHQGHTKQAAHGEICPTCFVTMPLTGICDNCN